MQETAPVGDRFSPERRTLPVGLQAAGSYMIDCGVIMAGAAIAIIPVCVSLPFFVQRYVIEGAAGSGVNG